MTPNLNKIQATTAPKIARRIVIPKIKLQLIFSFWKCNIAQMGKERTKIIMKAFSATNQVSYI
jgi:hypothetical protein